MSPISYKIMAIIGAHVSTSGGLYTCFKRAKEIGATGIQIFGASPRQWNAKLPSEEDLQKYHQAQKDLGLGPVFLHASYLVNLASPNNELWQKSINNLAIHFEIANLLKASGLIFHLGSFKGWTKQQGLERLKDGVLAVLEKVKQENSYLVMENSSGGGDKIGGSIEDLGILFNSINNERVKICIDTQHTFASGSIKLYSKQNIDEFINLCDKAFGWDNVIALHINDSKTEYGSFKDRHENLGEGLIGIDGLKNLALNKKASQMVWLLEVPGFDNTGPDKCNIDIVKNLFL